MLASAMNRKVLAILLVGVGCLLVATLYKMETLSEFVKQMRTQDIRNNLPLPVPMVAAAEIKVIPVPAPLLKTHAEQVEAGDVLHQMLLKDRNEYKCSKVKYIKNRMEGAWKYCGDATFDLKKPCLVYSFGINYDFTFDDALGRLGCDVYSFDPSMSTKEHRRNPNVMFYKTGLSGFDNDTFEPKLDSYVKEKTTWKIRTLKTLMRELGHSNRTLDLLKIDIETSEWPAVRNMIDTGMHRQVKQFLVEWHIFPEYPARETFGQLIRILEDLKDAGFRSFDKNPHTPHLEWDKFNLQSDFGYVNIHFSS